MYYSMIKIIYFNEIISIIYRTPLYIAVEKGNTKIVKYLAMNDKTDINAFSIYIHIFQFNFNVLYFNSILNQLIQ